MIITTKKSRHKISLLKILCFLIPFFYIFSSLHLEFIWFRQFSWENILLTKWLIQSICFLLSLLVIIALYKWQSYWLSINSYNKSSYSVSGKEYGFRVFISATTAIISFILTARLCINSVDDSLLISDLNSVLLNNTNIIDISLIVIIFSVYLILLCLKQIQKLNIISSVLFSLTITSNWSIWALSVFIPDSGIKEPVLNSDISFSIGKFNSLFLASTILFVYILNILANTYVNYLARDSNLSNWSSYKLTSKHKKYLKPIVSLLLCLTGLLIWLSRYQLLWNENHSFPGPGWLDVNFTIPLRTLASISIFVFSFIIYLPKYGNKSKIIRLIPFLFTLSFLLLELILYPLLQWIFVKPRELSLQSKYIQRAISSTRKAFQLDKIKTTFINPETKVSADDLDLGGGTLRNIRLWDSQPLLATNRQLQQLKIYYRFSNAAVDRYQLKGGTNERQQVIISARELDQGSLPNRSRTWLNRHFVFTHGYGFTLSPVNTKAPDGLPDYFVSDIGDSTKFEGIQSLGISKEDVKESIPIGNAGIYFGNLASPYAIAPSKLKEFDYPKGDQNIFSHYKGSAGIPLNGYFKRLEASIYLFDPRIITTSSITKNSNLLIRRDIKSRLRAIVPFIKFKGDPYLVSVDVNKNSPEYTKNQYLYWIAEGYTTSTNYPYAASLFAGKKVRYIRNSVKAVIDAYNGKVFLYENEPKDPILQAWKSIFPNLFKKLESMPIGLRKHLLVPTELFDIQVRQLLRYHVTDPRTFYNGDDEWEVPKELYGKEQVPVEPYHITAQLNPNSSSEFLLLQPLSPLARPNLSAWLAARNDGKNYGELILLRFPGQTTIFGPEQIQALINQNPNISKQFSLWDRDGSEVIQGNLLVLPFGKSLLYVEPVYLKASKGGLPTLTRVVVSDGNNIVMEENLLEGIRKLVKDNKI